MNGAFRAVPRGGFAGGEAESQNSFTQVLFVFARMLLRYVLPSRILESLGSGYMWGAVLSVASVRIQDEGGAVFAGGLDRLAEVGALVATRRWRRVFPFLQMVTPTATLDAGPP